MTEIGESLLDDLAARLADAERTRTVISPLTDEYPDLTMAHAYAIQERLVEGIVARGAQVIGWKAGFTSRAMREQMNVDEPNRGYLLDYMRSDRDLDTTALIHPRVEPEIAFILGSDIEGPSVTATDVLAATRWVCAALEIVDSRFRDYKFRVQDNTADNSSAARVVLSSSLHAIDDLDLARLGVVLEKNGEIEQRGDGAAAFGHPALSVAWMANQLAESGHKLEAGQVIISGGLTSAPYLRPGDRVVAHIDRLGSVEVWA